MNILKYIGPFLRLNSLNLDNIEKQLLFFSRESFKHIVLQSNCGIRTSIQELKLKKFPNIDINIFKRNSPLLCIYKKANPKLEKNGWNEESFKKEILASSNAYMNLMLTDCTDYYKNFENIDSTLFALSKIYSQLSIKQLDFFSSNLRSSEGVFIDKKDCSNELTGELKFEDKSSKFKFSEQALFMAAYYKASLLSDNEDAEAYKNFSLDILNMFIDYKEEIYDLSFEELNNLCFAFNIFYEASKNEAAMHILYDLFDLLEEKYKDLNDEKINDRVHSLCMLNINFVRGYRNLSLLKYRDQANKIYQTLNSFYDNDLGMFIKKSEKKNIDFSAEEIVLYTLCQILMNKLNPDASQKILTEVYKRQLINSGLVLSWPDSPNLNSPERYRNFSNKEEDLLDENYFRMPSLSTPELNELAPIFVKSISYSKKKDTFETSKNSFYSNKNMPLLYTIHFLLK
ncbi:hypothetical protein N3C_0783 [Clostridium sp. N3C]|uniref:hypothetical protein n=1 Tax=Clostridium sp. N3C TaxID=1776758 RepID=UPI00092DEC42|nr:hypothetical protein [Clostridium sp. N3C]SCN22430.1 hypothetical protein N3C_0783 [Clostridium sp. N3C]